MPGEGPEAVASAEAFGLKNRRKTGLPGPLEILAVVRTFSVFSLL